MYDNKYKLKSDCLKEVRKKEHLLQTLYLYNQMFPFLCMTSAIASESYSYEPS